MNFLLPCDHVGITLFSTALFYRDTPRPLQIRARTIMTTARRSLLLTLATWVAFATVTPASGETLERVNKDLYRSASYEQALALLDGGTLDPIVESSIEAKAYRLLCLIALERNDDARLAIAAVLDADPFYQLPPVSPRVRSVFKEARQSLLPVIVQRVYADAKAAFDREDPDAITQFERVLGLLDDPDAAPAPVLADLRTVVAGFRDLSRLRAERPASPPPAAAPVETTPAVRDSPETPPPPAPPPPVSPAVYREEMPGLALPETLNQTLPRWILPARATGREMRAAEGALEIVIDENGDVVSARLLESFHPAYDDQLVKAAMSWKYRPARKDGEPVRFAKVILVRVDPPPR
jgi:TonB family protein